MRYSSTTQTASAAQTGEDKAKMIDTRVNAQTINKGSCVGDAAPTSSTWTSLYIYAASRSFLLPPHQVFIRTRSRRRKLIDANNTFIATEETRLHARGESSDIHDYSPGRSLDQRRQQSACGVTFRKFSQSTAVHSDQIYMTDDLFVVKNFMLYATDDIRDVMYDQHIFRFSLQFQSSKKVTRDIYLVIYYVRHSLKCNLEQRNCDILLECKAKGLQHVYRNNGLKPACGDRLWRLRPPITHKRAHRRT